MNYNPFLDALFSTWWVSYGTLALLVVLFIVFRKPLYFNRRRKKVLFWVYIIGLLVLFFTIMEVNPHWWGYGRALAAKEIALKNGVLVVVDYKRVPGGRTTSAYRVYRGQVLDPVSGEKNFRFLIGRDAELMGIMTDAIVFNYRNGVVFFSVKDGKQLMEWTEETLPGLYPELKAGVDVMGIDRNGRRAQVTSLDGSAWILNMRDRSISPQDRDEQTGEGEVENGLHLSGGQLMSGGVENQPLLALVSKDAAYKQKQLMSSAGAINSSLVFLEGQFIGMDTVNRCVVVQHYTTTEKTKFMLTAVSFDGQKKLWELDQETLTGMSPEEDQVFATYDPGATGLLYLVVVDETFGIRMKDGKVMWRTEL